MSNINHPLYYNSNGQETINKIHNLLTYNEFIGGIKFNILKYVDRCNYKHTIKIFPQVFKYFNHEKIKEDLKKALWYTNYAIDYLKLNDARESNYDAYLHRVTSIGLYSYEEIKNQVFLAIKETDFFAVKYLLEYTISNIKIIFN